MILECYVAERHKELVAFRSELLDCETEDVREAVREKRGRRSLGHNGLSCASV